MPDECTCICPGALIAICDLPSTPPTPTDTMSTSDPAPSSKDAPPFQANDVSGYKLYRRRFAGLLGIVRHFLRDITQRLVDPLHPCPSSACQSILNLVSAMAFPWFGPIANSSASIHSHTSPSRNVFIEDNPTAAYEFNIGLDRVNWLGNIVACASIPSAALAPWLVSRYGVRRTVRHMASTSLFRVIRDSSSAPVRDWCHFLDSRRLGSVCWHCKLPHWQQSLRSPHHRSSASHNTLTSPMPHEYLTRVISKLLASIPQAIFQVIPAKYSELWFNLQGRTTATMVMAVMNPIGAGLAQLISPLAGGPKQSVRVQAPRVVFPWNTNPSA